ncbi:MAG: prepilin-type N-terminal cleavage/methylation domain-containing protein [Bacilli bacterium]|nr:prepilin-type N-terminal cleavage/methylation domain-containing protein [Bacilli bacterium]
MNKKGFTLAELLGVITILAMLALLVTPVVTKTIKNNKQKLYNIQISKIEKAAYNYAIKNTDVLPEEGVTIVVTLGELKKEGLIDKEVRNPITKELFSDDLKIEIGNINNQYTYTVLDEEANEEKE